VVEQVLVVPAMFCVADCCCRGREGRSRNLSQRDICQIVQSLKIRAFKSARACIKQT
jgi:hypothetical protein